MTTNQIVFLKQILLITGCLVSDIGGSRRVGHTVRSLMREESDHK